MRPYANQCAYNLRKWTQRLKQLEANKQDEHAHLSTSSPRHPDDFMSAFPLTLPPAHRASHVEEPPSLWPLAPSDRSSETSSGSSESNLCSPAGSVSSFVFSPVSDSSNHRPPSSAGSNTSMSNTHPHPIADGHAAIRAAGKLGIRRQKSMNRNSWSPSAFSMAGPPKSAVTLLVSTNAAASILAPEKGVSDTIVVNPIKLEKSKLSRM